MTAIMEILFKDNKLYKVGDLVNVIKNNKGMISGRICEIKQERICLDCSKEYQSSLEWLSIDSIKAIEQKNETVVDWI